jgi:hypothetical protein
MLTADFARLLNELEPYLLAHNCSTTTVNLYVSILRSFRAFLEEQKVAEFDLDTWQMFKESLPISRHGMFSAAWRKLAKSAQEAGIAVFEIKRGSRKGQRSSQPLHPLAPALLVLFEKIRDVKRIRLITWKYAPVVKPYYYYNVNQDAAAAMDMALKMLKGFGYPNREPLPHEWLIPAEPNSAYAMSEREIRAIIKSTEVPLDFLRQGYYLNNVSASRTRVIENGKPYNHFRTTYGLECAGGKTGAALERWQHQKSGLTADEAEAERKARCQGKPKTWQAVEEARSLGIKLPDPLPQIQDDRKPEASMQKFLDNLDKFGKETVAGKGFEFFGEKLEKK